MKFSRYPKYKPSGVEWLGDVPKHWEVKRLKYSASINDEALPETTLSEFELTYVDIGNVGSAEGIIAAEQLTFDTAPSRARRIVRDGDTIVSTVRTYLRAIAPIRNPPENVIVSTGFAVIRPRMVDPHFLSYALRESSFVETIVARSVGVSYPAVNASEVGTIPIPLPESDEQRAIADFLDRETARLDTLLGKKRELIEKLMEKRTALISRTVTRGLPAEAAAKLGLNTHPKLTPSGIEWLGDIPEHWEVKRLRFVSRIQTGNTPPKSDDENYSDEGLLWVKPDNLSEFAPITQTKERLSVIGTRLARPIPNMSPLVCCIGTVGKFGYSTETVATNQQINAVVYDEAKVARRFGLYAIAAAEAEHIRRANVNVVAILNTGQQSNISVPVPPVSEQRAIEAFLDRETAKLDRMMEKVEAAIEKLQEYRTALITAAVTGKIDVRNGRT